MVAIFWPADSGLSRARKRLPDPESKLTECLPDACKAILARKLGTSLQIFEERIVLSGNDFVICLQERLIGEVMRRQLPACKMLTVLCQTELDCVKPQASGNLLSSPNLIFRTVADRLVANPL